MLIIAFSSTLDDFEYVHALDNENHAKNISTKNVHSSLVIIQYYNKLQEGTCEKRKNITSAVRQNHDIPEYQHR